MPRETTRNAADIRTTPDFARWFAESDIWTGSDYLWLNRFRDLYAEYADAHSALDYITNEVALHIAALDSLERILFGDVWRRSRDEMEARAEELARNV